MYYNQIFKYFQRTSLSTYQSSSDENFDKPRVEINHDEAEDKNNFEKERELRESRK